MDLLQLLLILSSLHDPFQFHLLAICQGNAVLVVSHMRGQNSSPVYLLPWTSGGSTSTRSNTLPAQVFYPNQMEIRNGILPPPPPPILEPADVSSPPPPPPPSSLEQGCFIWVRGHRRPRVVQYHEFQGHPWITLNLICSLPVWIFP